MSSVLPTPEPPDPVEGALGHFEHSNWLKASVKALDAALFKKAGGVISGDVDIDRGADSAVLALKGAAAAALNSYVGAGASFTKGHWFNNVRRWSQGVSAAAWDLSRFDASGVSQGSVLAFSNSTGLGTVAADPTAALGIATKQYADGQVPIGTIVAFAGTVAPAGWHLCNGTVHGSAALLALTGSTTTPDLRNRFLVAAGQTYALGATGGADNVTLTQAQTPLKSHTHSIDHDHAAVTSGTGSAHNHNMTHDHPDATTAAAGSHNHGGYHNNWYGSSMDQNPPGTDYSPIGQGPGHPDPPTLAPNAGNHTHTVDIPSRTANTGDESSHTHSVDLGNFTGTSGAGSDTNATAHENRPPYYAVTYIIKKG